ncbi:MAG TPA: RNase adapter RapZ [Clostridiales bacterium]|nr:RNase adapter RapZ [Clostridiales bacterium]HQP70142.1 RNase adapter RapZ [Clostridiales bacterium]
MKTNHQNLKISVYSFGYQKSGIPENEFGDGGGFVFDCRFLPNPFHDLTLREYTGLDKQIISFFSEYRSVKSFVEDCARMVEKAAESYLERGFSNIQVSFGCTGGRHRSVFCAEEFVKMMSSKGFSVSVEHTEL